MKLAIKLLIKQVWRGTRFNRLGFNTFLISLIFFLLGNSYFANSQSNCLTINLSNLVCELDATPENPFDDTYKFDLEIIGGSTGWRAEIGDSTFVGAYGETVPFKQLPINKGPFFVLVYDTLTPNCAASYTITPPSCNHCTNQTFSICNQESVLLSAYAQNLWAYPKFTDFQWYKDGQAIMGATDSFYVAKTAGVYEVEGYTLFTNQNVNCHGIACCKFTIETKDNFIAVDNELKSSCPNLGILGNVSANDINASGLSYQMITPPNAGMLQFDSSGFFSYLPMGNTCQIVQFEYQLCTTYGGCCDTGLVTLNLRDTIPPKMINIPPYDTISCDEAIPIVPLVTALDNCPYLSIDVTESSTQGEDGCSLYDYVLTRTWEAKDNCENITLDSQKVIVEDNTAPDIFRIYTLPNGKRLVAGVMENVNQRWKTVSLPIDFPTKPAVFTQVITSNDPTPTICRLRNISPHQFDLRLQEEEQNDQLHKRESVAWIALETGTQSSHFPMEVGTFLANEHWQTITFASPFAAPPILLSNLQSIIDADPATTRHQNITTHQMTLRIEEETSLDMEVTHPAEHIAFWAIENNQDITNDKGEIIGETGITLSNNNWKNVLTKNTYHNPIVIANGLSANDNSPATVRVKNVVNNGFQVKVEEWAYQDGQHANEAVHFIVIEGSLPLDGQPFCEYGTDSLEIGKDIIALDNCDVVVALNLTETNHTEGATKIYNRIWSAIDECGNSTRLTQNIACEGVAIRVKSVLQGALLNSPEAPLMRDDLRKKGLLPVEEPYTALRRFKHQKNGGGEQLDTNLLNVVGKDAPVDWVFLELLDSLNAEEAVASCAALIQRDGDIMAANGDTIIVFEQVVPGNYHVAISHRNHLKVKTLTSYLLNPLNIPLVNFTYTYTPVFGNYPFVKIAQKNTLWSGDLNGDQKIIYQGPDNDIFYMFLNVVLNNTNTTTLTNFISTGYFTEDFNLDGTVIFQGPNNDRSLLLFNTILKHPQNAYKYPNFILQIKDNN